MPFRFPEMPLPGKNSTMHQTYALSDAFNQGRLQYWVDLEVHQLGAGAYQGVSTTLCSANMQLVHERQNRLIHKTGMLPRNRCTISFALGQDPLKRFSHFKDPAPLTFLLPETTELDILVPAHVDTLYLCLEQDRFLSSARILNPRFWDRPLQGLHGFNTPETGKLGANLLNLLRFDVNGGLSAQTENLLLDSVLLALNQSTEVLGNDNQKYKGRQLAIQRVKRAREFIDASLQAGLLPSMVDLCATTCASARTLQYAFGDVMQMTPIAYLRILRLNKVRSMLQTAGPAEITVTQSATKWGFFHLGEFARDYRHLFGERPSETLARSDLRNQVP